MHSGSYISPKHPAIPVSIGIASIVLEGRPAILGEGTAGDGDATGTGQGGGTATTSDEDGGFSIERCRRFGSIDTTERENHLSVAECQKSFISDAAKRITLKLQQIRSCPGTSKDVLKNMVTVEASSSSRRRGGIDEHEEYEGYGVERFACDGISDTSPLLCSTKGWGRDHIYSGFEKMKLLGAVSPIKVPAVPAPFINFPTSTNTRKKSDAGSHGTSSSKQRPREGPHCEQFLKKVGVIKIDTNEDIEHNCSYRNEFCLRWQAYFKQLSSILTSGEAICIEVFLGPENHAILLEQWTLQLKTKTSESTMTIQSLCAAIRSQLYFSQISAWTDLIKNSLEPEIFNNPRVKKSSIDTTPMNDSCIAGSDGTSPSALPTARLDILFRIRGHDNTASFNEKPNIHNFPDAIVADNYVIQVCLKSLPRLERIPRIFDDIDSKMDEGLVNDHMDMPCHEKGKHRCAFQDEEEEDANIGDDDLSSAANSHREKQLMKYKKRLMKREKKKKAQEISTSGSSIGLNENYPTMLSGLALCKTTALNIPTANHKSNCNVSPYTSSINLIQPPLYSNCDDLYQPASYAKNTKATQTAVFLNISNSGNVSTVSTQTDASGCCCLCVKQQVSEPDKMMSTNSDSTMQYINSNYNHRDYTKDDCDTIQLEAENVVHSEKKYEQSASTGLRKAEMLLQAIQRTAIINDHQQPDSAYFKNNNYYSGSYNDNNNTDSDTVKCERSECDTFTFSKEALDLGDCRLCKRQKTKHNFKLAFSKKDSSSSNQHSPPGCRRTLSESLVGHFTIPPSPGGDDDSDSNADLVNGFNYHNQHREDDDLRSTLSSSTGAVRSTAISFEQLKSYRRAFSEDVIDTISMSKVATMKIIDKNNTSVNDVDPAEYIKPVKKCNCPVTLAIPTPTEFQERHFTFITPKTERLQASTPTSDSCSDPLYVSCVESDCSFSTASSASPHKKQILSCTAVTSSVTQNKQSSHYTTPKVNLNNIFSMSPLAREDSGFASSTSPIPIDESAFNYPGSTDRLNVQKPPSLSTCQLSPGSLSPRFLRHAYKQQRSRNLSEHSSFSERSSVGSDEQLSDDEYLPEQSTIECSNTQQLTSSTTPNTSLKFGTLHRQFSRTFSKNLFKFGRLPLLSTLEESLLQRRVAPKFQVADFKVLLGASGSFCPTQLTIPAASYFYELSGQHLTTPYVCELRLPRKGYSIPRQGTVQVTLLNPLGMVVRMFVVPYDFRDMPAMSTTFIRQRILAYDDKGVPTSTKNVEQLSNSEQMKLLRYAIHLRFQTSRSGKLSLHTDIRLLISRRTDCDTAAAHAKNLLEAPNELKVVTIVPENPRFSLRMDKQ